MHYAHKIFGLLSQLHKIERTPEHERWPGALWPSEQAFKDAETFIDTLPSSIHHVPGIYLADDGEIDFLWEFDGIDIDVGFYGEKTFSYFAKNKDCEFYDDHVLASNGLPEQILNWLGG